MSIKKLNSVLPGDRLAVIEEFGSSYGTYLNGEVIRAARVGKVSYDLEKREIKVDPSRQIKRIPMPRDSIIGQIESLQGNTSNVRIYYLNSQRNFGGFTGMLISIPESAYKKTRQKRVIFCKPGDIVRAKVTSSENATIHLSLSGEENGVLFTVCSYCGGKVNRFDHKIRCVECGTVDERKLSVDFGKNYLG